MESKVMFAWKGILAEINRDQLSPNKIQKKLAQAGFRLTWTSEPNALLLRGALISAGQMIKPSIEGLNKDIFNPIGCEISISE